MKATLVKDTDRITPKDRLVANLWEGTRGVDTPKSPTQITKSVEENQGIISCSVCPKRVEKRHSLCKSCRQWLKFKRAMETQATIQKALERT